ncbi:hypothetical protein OH491_17420 [Termitidicoccus mucosus]|uniref:Uncharacterized protein n=1 Tax=Termitidicoccus mucosus TaxID=1184151 RepID=A0A178IJ05_9BACT|nr:hypothetical protein AW736_11175 [Opitutaceae bacterium TSB47]
MSGLLESIRRFFVAETELAPSRRPRQSAGMSAVVSKKKRMPARPRARGVKIVKRARPLSPTALGDLADKLANATSEAEAAKLKRQFIDGFYGVRTLAV